MGIFIMLRKSHSRLASLSMSMHMFTFKKKIKKNTVESVLSLFLAERDRWLRHWMQTIAVAFSSPGCQVILTKQVQWNSLKCHLDGLPGKRYCAVCFSNLHRSIGTPSPKKSSWTVCIQAWLQHSLFARKSSFRRTSHILFFFLLNCGCKEDRSNWFRVALELFFCYKFLETSVVCFFWLFAKVIVCIILLLLEKKKKGTQNMGKSLILFRENELTSCLCDKVKIF